MLAVTRHIQRSGPLTKSFKLERLRPRTLRKLADPFSTFTGALTVGDVCLRVGRYLKSIHTTSKQINEEIESLEREIASFNDVYTALEQLFGSNDVWPKNAKDPNDPSTTLKVRAGELVQEGQSLVEQLQDLLYEVIGRKPLSKWPRAEDLRKAIRMLSKNEKYSKIRQRFSKLTLELNTMLAALQLTSNAQFHFNSYASIEQLPGKISHELQTLGLELKARIDRLDRRDEKLEPSILSAKAAIAFASLNKHFYVQNSDTSIWTGREAKLEKLKTAMLMPNPAVEYRTQKRFVVHGIAGAGKTQFCCKFAQDYRESFWGIFWVDASNPQSAAESWKKIATLSGREPNEDTGKNWLSNLQTPWLLIIDSADQSEESIRAHFPTGERGCVLVTSRNPRIRINATVGYLSLDKLEKDEANDLLRKATNHTPWDASAKQCAASIASYLGYLPLVLIHAGRAISHKFCSLQEYIPYFNKAIDNLSLRKQTLVEEEEEDDLGVFASFDIIYSGLEAQAQRGRQNCRDAVELVNIFAYLHSSEIRLDTLTRTGKNMGKAVAEQARSGNASSSAAAPSLNQRLRKLVTSIGAKLLTPTTVLPRMYHHLQTSAFEEAHARRAMDVLVRMSMVSESSEIGCYSMHPLVHVWARKRLSSAEQVVWCQAAANVLASSIKLPSVAEEPSDRDYHLRIKPHVNEVRSIREELTCQMQRRRREESRWSIWRNWLWLNPSSQFTWSEAVNFAKFGRVYMDCGDYHEAEALQRQVHDFLVAHWDEQHTLSIQIQLALSNALFHQGQFAEAAEFQQKAWNTCRSTLGDLHPQTLKIIDAMGETSWHRGLYEKTKTFQESAVRGLERYPEYVREAMNALVNLGEVHYAYFDYQKAHDAHQRAVDRLTEEFGDEDFDVTIAMESLAKTKLAIGGAREVCRSNELMQKVSLQRREKLGKEHPYTLLAECNLARAMASRGSLEKNQAYVTDAKAIMINSINVASRNLGPEHFGTLFGRMHLAQMLVIEGNYSDAESEFKDVMEKQKHLQGAEARTYPDRLASMDMLADCYELQGRYQEGIDVCETVIHELDAGGAGQHPLRQKTVEKKERLVQL